MPNNRETTEAWCPKAPDIGLLPGMIDTLETGVWDQICSVTGYATRGAAKLKGWSVVRVTVQEISP